MKKIIGIVATLLFVGCAVREHYIRLVREVQPKAVMIEVDTVMPRLTLSFEDGSLSIHMSTAPVTFMGAGVHISAAGHILTCSHLFTHEPINAIRVYELDGSSVSATVLYISTTMDLGLLKLPLTTPHNYAILSQDHLSIGQEVMAVGNPSGLGFSVSHGIISAFRPTFDQGYDFTQVDAAINPGNSGGPLFNLNGELIGINTLKEENTDGIAFAVAPETIRKFMNLFIGVN